VPDVLAMSAFKLGHPMAFLVLMEACDFAFHARAGSRGATGLN
jgi:hypothetical protein